MNKSTAAYYFQRLGTIISHALAEKMALKGAIEVGEIYFVGRANVDEERPEKYRRLAF